ncbi:MAG TPA: endonuclease/exonuclease/phosphatase family protein [Bryobacteraceae bacterium]|nr:endonuclease/exonuclease/phosphatase family protein [Bryobacteraceae bacterium]
MRVWWVLFVCSLAGGWAADSQHARVMSINLANKRDAHKIADEIRSRAGGVPDILLLQEVARERGADKSVAEQVGALLGLQAAFEAPKPGPTTVGVAVLSRWPMSDKTVRVVPRFYRIIKVRPRLALGVTAHAPGGPIRVWTTHLDMRINVQERLRQLRPILADVDAFPGPTIVGGDLNTLRMGWLLHIFPYPTGNAHAHAVTELMRKHGFETPFTERRATFDLFGQQLDWVYLRGLRAVKNGIQPVAFSDHHAVWADFVVPASPGS